MGIRIKKGDTVQVIRGDEKGKRGKVLRVLPQADRVVIENINYIKKHLRRSQQHPRGGRIEKEAAIHISNVMLVDPESGELTRVRFETTSVGGKSVKQRKSVKSNSVLP